MNLEDLKINEEAPNWLSAEAFAVLSKGYMLENETPKGMYWRVANSSAKYLKKPELAKKFFELMWNNWLCPATPVLSNAGTTRGHVISCFGVNVDDSILSILDKAKEIGLLIKHGGGVGVYVGNLRDKGSVISKGNGTTDGIIPFLKIYESIFQGIAQGGVRRGAAAVYDRIRSVESHDLITIRKKTGSDLSRKCLSTGFHHAFNLDDEFMEECKTGNVLSRQTWQLLMRTRHEEGEPYLSWTGNMNRNRPDCYKKLGLEVQHSQLCSEIFLYSDLDHTYVCCLSSMNVARFDEWKDTDAVELAIWFLDGIMEEFIQRAKETPGFENAVRSAIKGRPLGLGQLGWHTLLQSKMIPFESFDAMKLNAEVARTIQEKSLAGSQQLALEYGEPEWCKGFGIRNTHRTAIAPTFSNAIVSGGLSQGIEPIAGNCYAQKTAKGMFIRKNKQLEDLLTSKGRNTMGVWEQINDRKGSVAGLSFLSVDEKAVFATAREINQFTIIQQAAQRQVFICQGQSVNTFFAAVENVTDENDKARLGKYIHDVHRMAYDLGLNSVYYLKSAAVMSGDKVFREDGECSNCEA